MEAVEFGKENNRKIVPIPDNMMSRRQFENVTSRNQYRLFHKIRG